MQGRNAQGIALISVLLIMLAVLVLGVGTLFLTQGNLLISKNLLSTSVARNNAESGIDATVAVMRAHYEATGELPTTLQRAPRVQLADGELDYAFFRTPEWEDNQVKQIGRATCRERL